MRANIFQTSWIMLKSISIFLKYAFIAIYETARGRLTRKRADFFIREWAKNILHVVDVRCQVFNPHNVDFTDKHRHIIMINHSSLYDIPISYIALDGTFRMLAKKELFRIPIFSQTMRAVETPSIDRQNREQAIKDLAHVRSMMESGTNIWIAPEGTRSRTGKLLPLKKGGFIMAIDSEAMITPVGIRNADKILPPKTFKFHLHQNVEIHIGEPIDASQYTLENKDKLIKKVSDKLKELANL